jgi:hypothetical protein
MQSWFMPHKDPKIPKPPQPAGPTARSTITGAGVAPGTTSDDFQKQQQAYYQQLLSGTGQMPEGGSLPQSIQDNINKQASLI